MSTLREIMNDPGRWILPWSIDVDTAYLLHDGGPYGIPLIEFRTLADLGRWVRHIAGKTWGTPEVLQRLVFAYDEINWDLA